MYRSLVSLLSVIVVFSVISCSRSVNSGNEKSDEKQEATKKEQKMTGAKVSAGPPVYIYKTRNDYYNKVPVILSENKQEIVSYPGVKDVYTGGELAYPTRLEQGYLLDNRGISEHAAFLSLTYEEYSNLPKTPEKEKLYDMILDKDPFTELYHCGSRFDFKELVPEVNKMIAEDKLGACEKLK